MKVEVSYVMDLSKAPELRMHTLEKHQNLF